MYVLDFNSSMLMLMLMLILNFDFDFIIKSVMNVNSFS